MKVLQMLYSGLGGHGSVAFSLVNADDGSHWNPVMGFIGIEPLLPSYHSFCCERKIEHKYFQAYAGRPWRNWSELYKWFKQIRPDAIIIHSAGSIFPAALYSIINRCQIVYVEHQPNSLKRISEWICSGFGQIFANKIVLLTEEYQLELKEKLRPLFITSKIVIIPNGIDLRTFTPVTPFLPNTKICLGMAARFSKTKRQDILIQMLVFLRKVAPNFEWHLSLAGDGETSSWLKELVANNNLQNYVTFTGSLNEPELVKWFKTIDIYIHASNGETLSTSILQAMSSRLPIIASNVSGISNLIAQKQKCGTLVTNQSDEAFGNAVLAMVHNPESVNLQAQNARKYVEETFDDFKMFSSYNSILGNKK